MASFGGSAGSNTPGQPRESSERSRRKSRKRRLTEDCRDVVSSVRDTRQTKKGSWTTLPASASALTGVVTVIRHLLPAELILVIVLLRSDVAYSVGAYDSDPP